MWDEVGRLQFDFLVKLGLKPGHRFLDVGCGCLRGGVHFISYLEDGHYYGIDANEFLLEAGRKEELPLAGLEKAEVNLLCRADFAFAEFETEFDFAIAQSVMTHLPLNSIRRCLLEMKKVLAPGGVFAATFFDDPRLKHGTSPMTHQPGGITTYPDRDPYHYDFGLLKDLARRSGLRAKNLGQWNHPRSQSIALFKHDPWIATQINRLLR